MYELFIFVGMDCLILSFIIFSLFWNGVLSSDRSLKHEFIFLHIYKLANYLAEGTISFHLKFMRDLNDSL